MTMRASHLLKLLFILVLGAVLVTPQAVLAQNHIVTPSDLQKDVAAASSTRQKHLAQVDGFLSSSEAQQAMKSVHINPQQIKNAIPQLNDDELAQLSARSEQVQKDFAAGRITDRDLLLIVVAVLALILIIVAVR
jgi:Flp pilus assembly protein TadB